MRKLMFCLLVSLPVISFGQVVVVDSINLAPKAGNGIAPIGLAINSNTSKLYTANVGSDNVSVVDILTDSVIKVIEVDSLPYGVGINTTSNKIYVANLYGNNVSVINGSTNTVIKTISVNNRPACIGVNPQTNKIYVAQDTNFISVINSSTDSVIKTILTGSTNNEPISIAVDLNKNKIYVVNYSGDNVFVIDGSADSVMANIKVGHNPFSIGINSATNKIYVANQTNDTISIIDATTDSVIKNIGTNWPQGIAVNSKLNKIYIGAFNSVSVMDGSVDSIVKIIKINGWAVNVSVDSNTNNVYTANYLSNTVSVIDGSKDSLVKTISVSSVPAGIDIDLNKIYVANNDNVSVVDASTHSLIKTVATGNVTEGVGINHTTHKTYVANELGRTISVINNLTDSVIKNIDADYWPAKIAVNPISNKIYCTAFLQGWPGIAVINGANDSIVDIIRQQSIHSLQGGISINKNTNKIYFADSYVDSLFIADGTIDSVIKAIKLGDAPSGVGVNLFTNKIYIANKSDNNVSVIDGASDSIIGTIDVGTYPQDIGVNSDINRVYVLNTGSNSISVIDGNIDSVIQTVNIGKEPTFITVNDTAGRIYVTCYKEGKVLVLVDMNAVEENQTPTLQNPKLEIHSNPSFQSTVISYQISVKSKVKLRVYDLTGRCVKTMVNGEKEAGEYSVSLDGKDLKNGIYFLKFSSGNYKETRKLVLMK